MTKESKLAMMPWWPADFIATCVRDNSTPAPLCNFGPVFPGFSRATLYNDITAGLIATIKDRKRRFVPGAEIARRSAAG